ncbi:allantoate amidohydrolase [Microvirga massiliensis]|uniref:allantoate amidohydrolase n=1 Tax=Microvirga massiliensis TaxID=1033741 RepID=UPI00062BE7F5|nr:allantoate amidohydrolase [Microvirga massiliensis]
MPASSDLRLGRRTMELLEQLARHTDEPGRLTRLYLSLAHRRAAEATCVMIEEAGLAAQIDALGSVAGRWDGRRPDEPGVIIGSHIDTVVDAGRFDGTLGVVLGIVAVEELRREGFDPSCPIEVLAFGDEENARFPTNLSTSHALAGRYDPAWLDGKDSGGITLREALVSFGGDPGGIDALARRPGSVRGYLEVHIEQGPLLEAQDRALGIVTAINGISRARLAVTGEAGHAGTVPMSMRRDALAAAAEMIAVVERIGARHSETVATVGAARVEPGAVNVIPAEVRWTLDARAPDDAVRDEMVKAILEECEAIARRRGVTLAIEPTMDSPATPMDPHLAALLGNACCSIGEEPLHLASGAGHDAVAMAHLCPAAMLFVRCKGGISHNPAESITVEDADAAARALIESVRMIAG